MEGSLEIAVKTVVSTVASAVMVHPTVVVAITVTVALGFYRVKLNKRDQVFYYNPNQSLVETYCVVCLHDAVEGERLRRLPYCKHCFHADCIGTWFEAHSTCPLCRSQVSLPHHSQPTLLSDYIVLLKLIVSKIGNPLSFEIPLAFCDSLGYIP